MRSLIGHGAEALVFEFDGTVLKERVSKKYRLPILDEKLRKARTRKEANILKKLESFDFPSPRLLSVDESSMEIVMSLINGEKVRDVLDGQIGIAQEIGLQVGILHRHDIVHSDLTTSNMILSGGKVHLIDFGLSHVSKKVEDKAVDIHLLHHALESKHHSVHRECMELVVKGYKAAYSEADKVLERLKVVQKRGRNKK